MKRTLTMLLIPFALAGCDRLADRMGMPDPAKSEADAKAIGAACRHAGRGLEDCYQQNGRASKAAVYAGWKEMNEYMMKNDMQAIPPDHGSKAGAKVRSPSEPAAGTVKEAARNPLDKDKSAAEAAAKPVPEKPH